MNDADVMFRIEIQLQRNGKLITRIGHLDDAKVAHYVVFAGMLENAKQDILRARYDEKENK